MRGGVALGGGESRAAAAPLTAAQPPRRATARADAVWRRARLLADRLEGGLAQSRPELLASVQRLRQLAAHPVAAAGTFAVKKLVDATRPKDRGDDFSRSR